MNIEQTDDSRQTDVIDIASQQEMRATLSAVHQARARCKRDQEVRDDGTYAVNECDDCGNPIGGQRLAVAIRNKLCVHCAAAEEKLLRYRGR